MNDSELAALRAKLDDIAQKLAKVKEKGQTLNEAQTELVILDPLLLMLGYDVMETAKQEHNTTTGGKPDYTVLPDTSNTWFLEGKRLDLTLSDGDAAQAVNYAANHGARWAVLTNGRKWYIYDAHLVGKPLDEKRILQIADVFADADAVPTLALLSRDAMCGGGILAAQALQQLNAIVRRELETPGSNLRKSLQDTVQAETGGTVSDEAVGAALSALLSGSVPDPPAPVSIPNPLPPVPAPVLAPDASIVPAPSGAWHTLEELKANVDLVTGHKPGFVSFDGAITVTVKTWSETTRAVVEWLGANYTLPPLPFTTGGRSKKYFLNTVPVRADGQPMKGFVMAIVNGHTIAADTNRDALNTIQALLTLIDAAGAPADAVRVELQTD